jgi:tetratricopeptide (TPR) repeat protein
VTIVLVLQFISVGNAMMADRYSYLAYIGLAFIAGSGFELAITKYPASRILIGAFMVAFIGWFCILTYQRTKTWTNSETLWSDVIQKYPAASTAYKNRGNYYGQQGKMNEALEDYNVLLSMNTEDPEVFNNLANIYAAQNKIAESLNASSKAIALKPNYANAYFNRGITYSSVKKYSEAINDFSQAISINPKNVQSYLQRGLAYYSENDYQKAVNDFSTVLTLQPNNGAAFYYRGLARIGLQQQDAAISDLQQAQALGYEGDYSFLKSQHR